MRAVLAGLALLALAGCGGAAAERGSRPVPDVLPGLASSQRTLDEQALAKDSYRPNELARVLEQAEYESGAEREFAGHSRTFEHVVARRLRFASPAGADRYLGWIRTHPDDFLGRSRSEQPLPLGESALLFSLARCGSCRKEQPTFLAAWRERSTVISLLAAGPGVNRVRFARLAGEVDARMAA